MDKILDFIEKHKYGIIIALFVHVGLFIYFQISTYQEVVVYEPWDFRAKDTEAPDDIEVEEEQIETIEEFELFEMTQPEEISSHVKSTDDERETTSDPNDYYTSYQGDAYENVKDFESQVIKDLQKGRESSSPEDSKSNMDVEKGEGGESDEKSQSDEKQGSKKTVEGKTMVEWTLSGRYPHNKNDWHVRNPGYTCGEVNGTVTVEIRVDQSGNVTNAKYLPELSNNADHCMIRQAEQYALKSRFNYDPSAEKSQTGRITYLFVFRS